MKKFSYIAKNKDGKVREGILESDNKDTVLESLKKQKLSPITIKEIKGSTFGNINDIGYVSSSEKVMFSKGLSTMVSAGIPIVQAIHILEEQVQSKKLKRATAQIANDIEGGLSLSNALSKHPSIFSPLYINMVKAGEIGGILDETLEKMADEIESEHELVASIRGAMAYPLVILTALVGVVVYLLVSIIPQIGAVFTELGSELPVSTRFLIFISDSVISYGLLIAIVTIGLIFGIRFVVKKNQKVRYYWHYGLMKTPVFGKLIKKINITRFTRTLGSLLTSGVAILEAIDVSANILKNEVFKKEIKEAATKVKDGSSLAEPLKKSKVFPVMVSSMIAVGEETGTLDHILGKLTSFYQKEVDHTVKNLSSLLEPIMMIIIGIGAGFVVISVITPIYTMTTLF